MAGAALRRVAAGAILPRRLHVARGAQPAGVEPSPAAVRPAVSLRLGDLARDRRRSQASGCPNRSARHPAHLEPKAHSSSPPPLSRAGRWTVDRRRLVGAVPASLLPARTGPLQAVSRQISGG